MVYQGKGNDMEENRIDEICPEDDMSGNCCDMTGHAGCCCGNDTGRMKHRDHDSKEYKSLLTRLNRIEGQVRGIKGMVEDDRYCVDILTQVGAIQAALNAFNKELLAQHIHSCVVEDIRDGRDEVVDELVEVVKKLMK